MEPVRARNCRKLARLAPGVYATALESSKSWCDDFHGLPDVSVRQIPPNRRSVTGLHPSRKSGGMRAFESTLERDFVTLLEFDPAVDTYGEQPERILYRAPDHKTHSYTPDFLVHYRNSAPSVLCEIKYRRELFESWRDLKERLKAGRRFAAERGWRFQIFTEVEIRTPYLTNARFLLPYQRCQPNWDDAKRLVDTLRQAESMTPKALIESIYADLGDRARILPTLWKLVGDRFVGADLDERLTMESRIWAR